MFDRFTERARRAMGSAREAAVRLESAEIAPGHVLLGLLQDAASVATGALGALGAAPDDIGRAVEERMGRGPGAPEGRMPFSASCKTAFELALEEAGVRGHNHIGVEHILLGILREKEGVAGAVLREVGLEPDRIREELVGRRDASTTVRGLYLSGDCDSTDLPEFAGQVDGLIEQGHSRFFFDMRNVTFVNSAALGFLVRTKKIAQGKGGDLVLVRPSDFVRTTMLTLGLDELFKVFANEEDAERYFESGCDAASVDLMAQAVEAGDRVMGMGAIVFRLLSSQDSDVLDAIGRIADLRRKGPVVRWQIPLPDREETGCGVTTENFDERIRVGASFAIEFRRPLAKTTHVVRAEARATSVEKTAGEDGVQEAVMELEYTSIDGRDRELLDRYLDDLEQFLGEMG
jgi:anti-anti-sigma factor